MPSKVDEPVAESPLEMGIEWGVVISTILVFVAVLSFARLTDRAIVLAGVILIVPGPLLTGALLARRPLIRMARRDE